MGADNLSQKAIVDDSDRLELKIATCYLGNLSKRIAKYRFYQINNHFFIQKFIYFYKKNCYFEKIYIKNRLKNLNRSSIKLMILI